MKLSPTPTALVCILLVAVASCSSEINPEQPEGGYLRFREALLSEDSDLLWECLSEGTKALFDDALNDLHAIEESLVSLSPADRTIVEERTTVRLLQVVDSSEALFMALVLLEDFSGDETYRIGSEVDELTIAADGTTATVLTSAGQEIELVREEDDIWRVSSLSEVVQNALDPIANDVMAVGVMVAESAYMRRGHDEILRLLGGGGETTAERPAPE